MPSANQHNSIYGWTASTMQPLTFLMLEMHLRSLILKVQLSLLLLKT